MPALPENLRKRYLVGGETKALEYLSARLKVEESAFKAGLYQPNQARPNILVPTKSLSAAISFGTVSIRTYGIKPSVPVFHICIWFCSIEYIGVSTTFTIKSIKEPFLHAWILLVN